MLDLSAQLMLFFGDDVPGDNKDRGSASNAHILSLLAISKCLKLEIWNEFPVFFWNFKSPPYHKNQNLLANNLFKKQKMTNGQHSNYPPLTNKKRKHLGFSIALRGNITDIIIMNQCNSIHVENMTKSTKWGKKKEGHQNIKKKQNIKAGEKTLNCIRLFFNLKWAPSYMVFWNVAKVFPVRKCGKRFHWVTLILQTIKRNLQDLIINEKSMESMLLTNRK